MIITFNVSINDIRRDRNCHFSPVFELSYNIFALTFAHVSYCYLFLQILFVLCPNKCSLNNSYDKSSLGMYLSLIIASYFVDYIN